MEKSQGSVQAAPNDHQASREDLDRILEIGRILASVLTEDEMEQLEALLSRDLEIGNTGVT